MIHSTEEMVEIEINGRRDAFSLSQINALVAKYPGRVFVSLNRGRGVALLGIRERRSYADISPVEVQTAFPGGLRGRTLGWDTFTPGYDFIYTR